MGTVFSWWWPFAMANLCDGGPLRWRTGICKPAPGNFRSSNLTYCIMPPISDVQLFCPVFSCPAYSISPREICIFVCCNFMSCIFLALHFHPSRFRRSVIFMHWYLVHQCYVLHFHFSWFWRSAIFTSCIFSRPHTNWDVGVFPRRSDATTVNDRSPSAVIFFCPLHSKHFSYYEHSFLDIVFRLF